MTYKKRPKVGQRYKIKGADLLLEPCKQIKISKVVNGIVYNEGGGWARLFQFFSIYEEISSDELKIETDSN